MAPMPVEAPVIKAVPAAEVFELLIFISIKGLISGRDRLAPEASSDDK